MHGVVESGQVATWRGKDMGKKEEGRWRQEEGGRRGEEAGRRGKKWKIGERGGRKREEEE